MFLNQCLDKKIKFIKIIPDKNIKEVGTNWQYIYLVESDNTIILKIPIPEK